MKSLIVEKRKKYPLWLWIAGLGAGIVNGLLGAGGGVVIVFALAAYAKGKSEVSVKDNFATTVASVLPISLVSAASYASSLNADFSGSWRYLVPAVVGGVSGAFIIDRINAKTIKFVFAVLTIIAGINMIMR